MDGAAPVATEPGRQTLAWPRDEWISARQLERLFGDAGPREIIVYHVGRLAEDREVSPRMNRTADLAMRLGCPTNVEVTIRPWSVHPEDDERETVTVYRVEGVKNARILVREDGTVLIVGNDKKVLFLNFGQRKRAEEFLQQRLLTGFKDSVLKSFNVEREFLDDVRRQAIFSDERRESPAKMQKPIRVDESKAPDQFGLTEGDIQELRRFIVQGTGRVETPADLNIEVGR